MARSMKEAQLRASSLSIDLRPLGNLVDPVDRLWGADRLLIADLDTR
jgi:hypothetical protein